MNATFKCIVVFVIKATLSCLAAADWSMFGGDPQRTSWAQGETDLTKENVGMLKLEWSLRLSNESRELNSLTVPVVRRQVITPTGFKEVLFVAGSSEKVFAIDADTGKLMWQKQFQTEGKPNNPPHWLCPNALNATPVLLGSTAYILASDGKLHALNLANGEDRMPPAQFTPAFAKPWSLNLVNDVLYTATSQGCNANRSTVYAMDLKNPAHRVISFGVAPTGGGGIWGRGGPAISSEGEVYVETGDGKFDAASGKYANSFVGLSAKDLTLIDYYTPANQAWIDKKDLDMGNMSPIIFQFQNWTMVAGSGKEGVIYLLDAKKLGGDDHRTPLYRSPLFANDEQNFQGRGFWGAMATAETPGKTRWLFAPAWGPPSEKVKFPKSYGDASNGSVMAFKVELKDNKPVLTPAWISRDIAEPEPPVIANGVVFALASGENVKQVDSGGRILTSVERYSTPKGNATLHALEAETGKELYSSGNLMRSFTHFSAPVVSGGRVYVSTYDGTVYAFGLGQAQ